MRRTASLLITLALMSGACTTEDDGAVDDADPTTTAVAIPDDGPPVDQTAAPVPTTSDAGVYVGRLVVIDDTGNVAVMRPDGSDPIPITTDGLPSVRYAQPTWDPDGSTLAFSRSSIDGHELVIHSVATDTSLRSAVPTPPFYFSWSTDGSRLAYLSNAGPFGALQLDVVDAAGAPLRSDVGQPYYFSWREASMVVHVGVDRIDVVDSDGVPQPWNLGVPGAFRAPQWTAAGIIYIEQTAAGGRLALASGAAEPRPLAGVIGGAVFVADAAGRRVAIQTISEGQNGVVARAQEEITTVPPNRLVVVDVATGDWEPVGVEAAIAFSWSPDGSRLLMLTLHDPSAFELAWRVWSAEGLSEATVFAPGESFTREVLPFFDQYAQSTTHWSPDGSAFAFPGAIDGDEGIWVVDIDGGVPPARVTGGSWVAWTAASGAP